MRSFISGLLILCALAVSACATPTHQSHDDAKSESTSNSATSVTESEPGC